MNNSLGDDKTWFHVFHYIYGNEKQTSITEAAWQKLFSEWCSVTRALYPDRVKGIYRKKPIVFCCRLVWVAPPSPVSWDRSNGSLPSLSLYLSTLCGAGTIHARLYLYYGGRCGRPQSNELTRGPPELVQHFRLQREFTLVHVLSLIWFGYIARLSQWGGGWLMVISSFKWFLPVFDKLRGKGEVGTLCGRPTEIKNYKESWELVECRREGTVQTFQCMQVECPSWGVNRVSHSHIKGTVSWDRFKKFWQKFTELDLTKGRGCFLNFLGAPMISKRKK